MKPASPAPADIDAVRQFNRFHTRLVGALDEHLLASPLALPQLRVLYEVAKAPRQAPMSARAIAEALQMDPGHLSRVVAALEGMGLIERTPAADHGKRLELRPTAEGRQLFAKVDAASAKEVAALLAPLSPAERRELVGAMARVRQLLGDTPASSTVILREPVPGDMGWIVHRQARLYAEEYGWDWTFEGLVAEIAGRFVQQFQPGLERCWVAEREGSVIGAVFVVRADEHTAQLRMLYVDAAARGLGLGRRLVDECIRFAQAAGYRRMVLWTNDILTAARHIYEATGFVLEREERHQSFGKDLNGQYWAREL
ncbi:MAG: bifunctional helix-turn-helix transcriptional regulator/GNAT family N-acetyltransferase [Hydrogenophaga sp.]|uniref:bifunctional helix-turn-helix transcriptional regulator/GNAT family N-acetyltransferase n=1 Tax=Hydrogenophaga sp. TaxID=1904254 RepID=UPI001D7DDF4F|nr:bifunctional helix-turn-helix transcriptional regulator/GNAT family N-acetyltransferase [Hydrogenophaga sp.]MBX3610615.1 bifunctional helix-turn-helix transcriptional regulator/GNAT family N-acetyltransferase [Hydrogenophaga sp.]